MRAVVSSSVGTEKQVEFAPIQHLAGHTGPLVESTPALRSNVSDPVAYRSCSMSTHLNALHPLQHPEERRDNGTSVNVHISFGV